MQFFTNFTEYLKFFLIPQIDGLSEPSQEKLIEFYDLMTNIRLEKLEPENEVKIRGLLPYFAKISAVRESMLKNQSISKQLFYSPCNEIIDAMYEKTVEFRAKNFTFGEEDDGFDMFYSFILDFNQQKDQ